MWQEFGHVLKNWEKGGKAGKDIGKGKSDPPRLPWSQGGSARAPKFPRMGIPPHHLRRERQNRVLNLHIKPPHQTEAFN